MRALPLLAVLCLPMLACASTSRHQPASVSDRQGTPCVAATGDARATVTVSHVELFERSAGRERPLATAELGATGRALPAGQCLPLDEAPALAAIALAPGQAYGVVLVATVPATDGPSRRWYRGLFCVVGEPGHRRVLPLRATPGEQQQDLAACQLRQAP
ncbi:hypothetical protein [Stenotrophomonas sp. 24(2023)]|uniref:hypothetical protein n=1 Tax=Stenotrophomonas sp. 24(2023) TaxID=3068324 RepID=UPI0027E14777|nr:hypothetical protein [Stenotrophomonas sp. 24(2023)]WMJ68802.1 hypothetical protein Q9R17_16695 [Stenotrophomonas sp. 24(2023)]